MDTIVVVILPVRPLASVRHVEGQRDVAVRWQGVWVWPGEWLHADEDGVVAAAAALA